MKVQNINIIIIILLSSLSSIYSWVLGIDLGSEYIKVLIKLNKLY